MVTKTTKYKTSNSHDIDEGLGIPEFDFESFESGFDKKLKGNGPVTEVVGSFASGVGASFIAPGIIESTIRRALPPEYGSALDLGQKSLGSARSLYNQAVRELKPAVTQLKQATSQILPKTEGILSKNIQEKLKDWSREEKSSDLSEDRMRSMAQSIEIGQLFQEQAKDTDRREEASRRAGQVQEGVEQLRHRDEMGRLGEIAESTSRMANFNDTVATSVYKKSLEVQLRSFYAVSDLLRETKIANVQKRAQLEAVVRNTGVVAISANAKNEGSFKNKFLDGAKRSMFGAARGFADEYIGNIHKDVSGKITNATSAAEGLTGMLSMLTSFADVDTGGSAKGTIANILGGFLGDHIVGKVQDKAKSYIEKVPGVQRGADKVGYGLENMGPLLSDYLTDSNNKLGPLEPFREYLTSMLPKTGVDAKIDVASLAKATDPAHFTNATQKSIIEVIPGLLARIQRELVITRTGKDAPLIAYDYKSNKFSTEKKIGADIRETFTGKQNQDQLKERFDELFGRIDPNQELDEGKRDRIKKQFLDRNFQGKSTDSKYLATKRAWGDDSDAEDIAKFFQKHLGANSVGKRDDKSLSAIKNQRDLSSDIGRLTRFFDDPRATVQMLAQMGQLGAIQASGLYNRKTNEIDLDQVSRGLLGGEGGGTRGDGDSMHEFDLESMLRPGEIRNPSFVQGSSRDAINRRPRKTQRDTRLVSQERNRRLSKAMAPVNQPPGAIPSAPVVTPTPVVGAAALNQTVEAKIDTAALQKLMSDQIDAIKKIDPNANLLTIIEVLRSVDKRLEGGINTYSLTEDLLGPEARDKFRSRFGEFGDKLKDKAGTLRSKAEELKDKAKQKAEDLKNQAAGFADSARNSTVGKRLTDFTLGDLFGASKDAVNSGVKFAGKIAGSIPGIAKTAFDVTRTVAGKGAALGESVLQKGADYFGDVYVEGESEPRLTRAKMKAGKYFDKKSGKVLTSLKDLKGPVLDEEGLEALSQDELEKSYVKGNKVRALKEVVGTAIDWGTQVSSAAVRGLGSFYGGVVTVGIKAFKMAQKLLPPYDVFVKGEEEPRLTAGGFKAGLYYSKTTGKPLTHPREIDGPVVNEDGKQTFITAEDYRIGLVDKNGLTVTNKVARVFGKVSGAVKGVLKTGFNALKGVMGAGKEFLVGIGQAVRDMFGGIFGLKGEYLETSKSQLEIQRQILQILMDRLPKGKNVRGDIDGDGIREGSAEDIRRKEAAETEKAAADKNSTAVNGPMGGKGLLASLAGMFGGKKKKDEDEDSEGGLLDDAADVADIYDAANGDGEKSGKRGRKGKAGKIAKTSNWLGKGGRLARAGGGVWNATKWAGRGALGLAGLGGLGLGGLAAGAASVGGTALGAVGTGLAATGTALGAVLTAPVLLTALGVAAVGTAGYYGYKYLTRQQLTTLNKVRFAQYGFTEQDKERLEAVFGLEQQLMKNVKIDGDRAYIENQKVDIEALMQSFGVKSNSNFSPTWLSWFQKRFKPVFLGHMAALKGVNPEVQLTDVDSKLKPEEKLKYLDASSMPDGPYDVLDAPFPGMDQLSMSSSGVKSAIELARDEIQKSIKGDKASTAAKAAGVAATGAAVLAKNKDETSVGVGNTPASGIDASQALKAAVGAGAAGAETVKDSSLNVSASSTVPGDYLFTGQKGQIDALSSIRFKAYGLVEMDISKIKDLSYLEVEVNKGISFSKDGAFYDEDIRDLLSRVKIKFGIVGPESPEGRDWVYWFRSRFLPVFLNYRSLVQKATGKEDYVRAETILTTQQQLDVANALITTTGIDRGRKTPIWNITYSPWRDYNVNTESSSTDLNIQFLTEAVKAVKAGEQKSSAKKKEESANEQAAINRGEAADTKWRLNTPAGNIAIPKDPISLRKDREAMAAKTGFIQPAPLNNNGQGVRAGGDFVKGAVIAHPGKGTGGDINSLPLPTGNNWTGMREMFEAAAKMTGVDVKTLAAMCAIESNFNPNAKASTSSASGLFQFLTKTWNGMLGKYGAKYGIDPRTPATDPRASILMGAEFIKENINTLKSRIKGKDISNTDVYMAHFLGAGGAAKFLNADPNAIGADVMRGPPGEDPVASNMNIFYDKNSKQPRTLGEIYKLFNMKMEREGKKAGLSDSGSQTSSVDKKDNLPTTDAPAAAGDRAGGGNVAKATPTTPPTTAPAVKNAGTAALAVANNTPVPVSAVATNVTPVAPQPVQKVDAIGTGGAYTAPSMPVAPAARTPIRPVPDFSGFAPQAKPTGMEINAQADAVRKAMSDGIVGIGKTLVDSLDVQRQILGGINTLVKNGGTGSATPVLDKAAAATKPIANAPSSPIPQRVQAAPVSMSRGQ